MLVLRTLNKQRQYNISTPVRYRHEWQITETNDKNPPLGTEIRARITLSIHAKERMKKPLTNSRSYGFDKATYLERRRK